MPYIGILNTKYVRNHIQNIFHAIYSTRAYSCVLVRTRAYSSVLVHTRAYSCVLERTRACWCVLVRTRVYSSVLERTRAYSSVLVRSRAYSSVLVGLLEYSRAVAHRGRNGNFSASILVLHSFRHVIRDLDKILHSQVTGQTGSDKNDFLSCLVCLRSTFKGAHMLLMNYIGRETT